MAISYPVARERNLIVGLLAGLAAVAWVVLRRRQLWTDDDGMSMGLTMGMTAPLFLAMWVTMMAAMMFPTAAPMILTFARVQAGRRRQGHTFISTWIFVGAYLALWSVLGVAAYGIAVSGQELASQWQWLAENAARVGGAVLVLAGLYQLSPLKQVCLSKCRAPMSFILTSWRDGQWGAVRMGLEHGYYCFGCCWLLFVILFPLGIMNIAAMALITLLIFAEKSLVIGSKVSRAAAAGLVLYGALVIVQTDALPTAM